MADATDMAPLTETVRGIEVRGVNLKTILNLVGRYPALKDAISGNGLDVNALFLVASDAIGPAIAAAAGRPEQWADSLDIETQIDLLIPILKLTFPNGVAPLVEKVATLINGLATSDDLPPTKSAGISLSSLPKASKPSTEAASA